MIFILLLHFHLFSLIRLLSISLPRLQVEENLFFYSGLKNRYSSCWSVRIENKVSLDLNLHALFPHISLSCIKSFFSALSLPLFRSSFFASKCCFLSCLEMKKNPIINFKKKKNEISAYYVISLQLDALWGCLQRAIPRLALACLYLPFDLSPPSCRARCYYLV